jgi:hypothetical protein
LFEASEIEDRVFLLRAKHPHLAWELDELARSLLKVKEGVRSLLVSVKEGREGLVFLSGRQHSSGTTAGVQDP